MMSRSFSLAPKLRFPSIKFRYGAARDQHQKTSGSGTAQVTVSSSGQVTSAPGEAIYDFQMPARWRRRPLSEEECDYINRGGPA